MMLVFLSYAEEDGVVGGQIAATLRDRGAQVYWWQDPAERGGRFISRIEAEMSRADRFLALMSPSFLRSAYCSRESELAVHREGDLQSTDPEGRFITVLEVQPTPRTAQAGMLRAYDWLPALNQSQRETTLSTVVGAAAAGGTATVPAPTETRPWSLSFRNRDQELEEVTHGLANMAGDHFWLVIAPPQLGKSWLVSHLATKMEGEHAWVTRRLDLRNRPDDESWDARHLLEQLFGISFGRTAGQPEVCKQVAQELLRRGRRHLCVLDSAELLDRAEVEALRSYLAGINDRIEDASRSSVQVGFIVASRRDEGWLNIRRGPRFRLLSLTEFKLGVVRHALADLAQQMDFTFTTAQTQRHAAIVHDLSEGLPALLVRCILWIQREQWQDIDRLSSDPDQFDRLAMPYITDVLLSEKSLFPLRPGGDTDPSRASKEALRVLAPYRFFTQSHLRHHIASDQRLHNAMDEDGWTTERLWNYLSETALLARPPIDPWLRTSPPIRRLLYRFFHRSVESQISIHEQASQFARKWSDGLTGSDQVCGLVEAFWHQAAAFRLAQDADFAAGLRDLATDLVVSLRESTSLSTYELRKNAADRLGSDEEFRALIEPVPRLWDELDRIIRPEGET